MKPIMLPCLLLVTLLSAPAHAASAPLAAKLDPRLAVAAQPGAEPVSVWVEFADKGEQGPADLAARLAQADRELTPRNRARREKAALRPLVDYLDLPLEPAYIEALRAQGLQPYGQSRWFDRVAVHAAGVQLERIAALPFVARIKPVEHAMLTPMPQAGTPVEGAAARPAGLLSAAGTPAFYGQTYTQLQRLGVPAMHDSGYTGQNVVICMLDDGFNFHDKHTATRDLQVLAMRDFVRGTSDPTDTLGGTGTPAAPASSFMHGEYTLSTLGGKAPGVYVGPAYGAKFMLGRTEYDPTEHPIEMTNWAMGAEWADSAGADVISCSLGYNTFDAPDAGLSITYQMLDGHTSVITRAAEIAAAKGILVVNSAGNDGQHPSVGYKISAPSDANGDSVICAAAVDSLGNHALYSSKGPTSDGRIKPDLSAQGSSVIMASAAGSPNVYVRNNGTSFSCPLIAGVAACMISARPLWPATLIIQALKKTASRAANPDTIYGAGIPNGLAALRWVPDTAGVPPSSGSGIAFALASANPMREDSGPLRVRFSIGSSATSRSGRVRAYDMQGRTVRTLWSGALTPGVPVEATWDGATDAGLRARPGVYLVSLEAGKDRATLRVASLR